MVKLLIIADDFTGALDTSIQFAKRGAVAEVHTEKDVEYEKLSPDVNVVVIDSETRHVSADEAYKVVYRIVDIALKQNIPFIYKKTDSVLRGNVGAELTALCERSGGRVHFVPAYPDMGRTTNNGIQYVDGVPVARSVFGEDPFDPVLTSNIPELIKNSSDVNVMLISKDDVVGEDKHNGIYIYDAETDKDLLNIAYKLNADHELVTCAGCAGFADALAEMLHIGGSKGSLPVFPEKMFVVCGSVNPVTVRQLDVAEEAGVMRIRLNSTMMLDEKWSATADAEEIIKYWVSVMQEEGNIILDVNSKYTQNASGEKINPDDRSIVSGNLGRIVKKVIDVESDAMFMLTGGDTLLGAMEALSVYSLRPITELIAGVVAFKFSYLGKDIYCISKSGGFGKENLILELCQILKQGNEISPEAISDEVLMKI